MLAYLPDGSFLLRRGYGARPSTLGPRGAILDLRCEKPGELWRLMYDGPARRTTFEELVKGPVGGMFPQPLQVDVNWAGTADIWNFGDAVKNEEWAAWHIEQSGHVRGTMKYDGKTIELDCGGHRDHSRGARHYPRMLGHCWIHGHFGNGVSFALFDLRYRDGDTVSQGGTAHAAVFKDGKIFKATYPELPYLTSPSGPTSIVYPSARQRTWHHAYQRQNSSQPSDHGQ